MIDLKSFANRIASLRHSAGLKQKDLADVCGVTAQAVSKWECGISCPDIQILDELASALGVGIADLLSATN